MTFPVPTPWVHPARRRESPFRAGALAEQPALAALPRDHRDTLASRPGLSYNMLMTRQQQKLRSLEKKILAWDWPNKIEALTSTAHKMEWQRVARAIKLG